MTKIEDIKRMVEQAMTRFGGVDILVNCAGQGYDAPVETTDLQILQCISELDLAGPLFAMQCVIPIMRRHGGGSIVNISSGTALMYLPNNGGYSTLKRALAHISLTAREELKKDGIVVSVVYPYMTDTDFEKNTIKDPSLLNQPEEREDTGRPPLDTAEYVAQVIFEGIKNGEPEIYAHDWMKKMLGTDT